MSSGGSRTTVEKADPWGPSQPYLLQIMEEAQRLYDSGALVPGQLQGATLTPQADETLIALGRARDRALGGSTLTTTAKSQLLGLLQDPDQSTTRSYYAGLAGGDRDDPVRGELEKLARGDYVKANSYTDRLFGDMADALTDRVNASAGLKGRTGSGAHQSVLQRGLGDLATEVYGTAYERERTNQLNALDALRNLQGQDTERRLAGIQGLDALDAERQRVLGSAIQAAPGLALDDYADIERLATVGQASEARTQAELDDANARAIAEQESAFDALARYDAILKGYGQLGGTATSKESSTASSSQILQNIGSGIGLLGAGASAGPAGLGVTLGLALLSGLFG